MRILLGHHHHRDRQKVQGRNRYHFVQGTSLVHHGAWGANANGSTNGVVHKRGHGRLCGERGNEIGRVNGDDGREEESGYANETGIDDEEKELEEEGEDVQKSVAVRQQLVHAWA